MMEPLYCKPPAVIEEPPTLNLHARGAASSKESVSTSPVTPPLPSPWRRRQQWTCQTEARTRMPRQRTWACSWTSTRTTSTSLAPPPPPPRHLPASGGGGGALAAGAACGREPPPWFGIPGAERGPKATPPPQARGPKPRRGHDPPPPPRADTPQCTPPPPRHGDCSPRVGHTLTP